MIDPAPTRRTTARTRRRGAVLTGVLATSLLPIAFGGSTNAGAVAATSKYVKITPERVIDSRLDLNRVDPLSATAAADLPLGGITVNGHIVVPADATAVVATFTVVNATNDGWLQVAPKGQVPAKPTSTLNVKTGNNVASTVFIPLGTGGAVTLTSTFGAEILVDVTGYFTAAGSSSDGRFVPLAEPQRLVDTRNNILPSPNLTPQDVPASTTTTVAATTTTVAATTTTTAPTTTTVPTDDGKGPRVLFVGDSITRGSGDATFRNVVSRALAADKCAADLVGDLVDNDPETNALELSTQFDNRMYGWPGATADDVGQYAGGVAANYEADVVVIDLGTNDAQLAGLDMNPAASTTTAVAPTVDSVVNQTLADITNMIGSIRADRGDFVKFVVVAPYDLDTDWARENYGPNLPGPLTNAVLDGLRTKLKTLESDTIRVVDAKTITSEDLKDGVHPNESGDAKLASLILPSLKASLDCTTAAATSTAAGAPQRVTRVNALRTAGSTVQIPIAGKAGVPTTGVGSVLVSLTATNVDGSGYLQLSDGTVSTSAYSTLNVTTGDTRANLAVVPLSALGNISLYTSVTADVIVDVIGYFTNETVSSGSSGLFVPTAPLRQYDSRTDPVTKTVKLPASDAAGKVAVVLNLTSTGNTGGAWVQVGPTPIVNGAYSNLNVPADSTDIAVGAVAKIGNDSSVDVYLGQGKSDLIVDVMGYFTGNS